MVLFEDDAAVKVKSRPRHPRAPGQPSLAPHLNRHFPDDPQICGDSTPYTTVEGTELSPQPTDSLILVIWLCSAAYLAELSVTQEL